MVKSIVLVNALVLGLLALIVVGGMFDMMMDVQKNGFEYEETVIIHGVVEIRQVSHKATLFSIGLMTAMTCVLLADFAIIWKNPKLQTSLNMDEFGDIEFPLGKPQSWSIASTDKDLEIQINDKSIKIPFEAFLPKVKEEIP